MRVRFPRLLLIEGFRLMMEFRHGLYRVFEFLAFVPFGVLYWLEVLGPKTDDAIYRFRKWCYQDPVYEVPDRYHAPVKAAVIVKRVSLTLGAIGIVAVLTAIGMTLISNSSSNLSGNTYTTGVQSIPAQSPVPVISPTANPSSPSFAPTPASAPISFVTKLITSAHALKPVTRRSIAPSPESRVSASVFTSPAFRQTFTSPSTPVASSHTYSAPVPSPSTTMISPSETPTPSTTTVQPTAVSTSATASPSPIPATPSPTPVISSPSDSDATASPTCKKHCGYHAKAN